VFAGSVNSSVVRVGIIEGEYHWHKHDDDDEFFYVVEGRLPIDLKETTIELNPGQGFAVRAPWCIKPEPPSARSF